METHQNTISTLRLLVNINDKTSQAFVKVAPRAFIKSVSEICYNILYGTFPLTNDDKQILKKFKKTLIKLPQSSDNIKRKIISKNVNLFKVILTVWPENTY